MIGKLKGTVDEIGEDYVLVDVHGVCYLAFCSARTLSRLNVGEAVVLHIETYVREDQLKLFGFTTPLERDGSVCFRWCRASARRCAGVLSTLTPSELANAIALQDKTAISRAPGVGPKVAIRILTELKNKAPAFAAKPRIWGLKQEIAKASPARPVPMPSRRLHHLGYSRDQAANAVAAALRNGGEGADSAKLIRLGLKEPPGESGLSIVRIRR